MLVCHDRKIVFVHIPKTAGSAISEALGFRGYSIADRHTVEDGTPDKYKDYLRICFVRNPWERALSAFKYTRLMVEKDKVKTQTARLYVRDHPDVGFAAFVSDFLASADLAKNIHFAPQISWLRRAQPQFVGRVENLDEDLRILSRLLNRPFKLRTLNASRDGGGPQAYDAETSRLVAHIYRHDIKYLNYSFPGSLG